MLIKEDHTVLKSTKISKKGPVPYRYVLRHIPKEENPSQPYLACRENMVLNGEVWEPSCRYWCAYRDSVEDAEREYQKRIDSEGNKA